ncbi:MAG: PIN domain-containing protein [Spirochaetia bacterium]|nr:PIN domain-containing protein [Spirochaetia bacterium]
MTAIDTNILVYYHRVDNKWHNEARQFILKLHESNEPWAIPYPCVSEFLAIVTHPEIFKIPTPAGEALKEIEYLSESPNLYFISEREKFLKIFQDIIVESKISGPKIHDARIAAISIEHGVSCLYSLDRDFSRIKKIKTVNPFI